MDTLIQETLEELLRRISTPFRKIRIEKMDDNTYRANIESEEPSLLIGHHGENIYALQNILRTIIFKKQPGEYNVIIDVDDYRKRQEENVLKLAERKVEAVRKTSHAQDLPAMSPYFRRLIHMHLATPEYSDIETQSEGEGDYRHLTIKPKETKEAII
jgi:spoIIIJ-associated protein